jgi:hypothetical protein
MITLMPRQITKLQKSNLNGNLLLKLCYSSMT